MSYTQANRGQTWPGWADRPNTSEQDRSSIADRTKADQVQAGQARASKGHTGQVQAGQGQAGQAGQASTDRLDTHRQTRHRVARKRQTREGGRSVTLRWSTRKEHWHSGLGIRVKLPLS